MRTTAAGNPDKPRSDLKRPFSLRTVSVLVQRGLFLKSVKGALEMLTKHLTLEQAVTYSIQTYAIRYSPRYLAKLRCMGEGPRFVTHGRRIYFLPDDLDEWVRSRTHAYRTTAERAVIIAKAKNASVKERAKNTRYPKETAKHRGIYSPYRNPGICWPLSSLYGCKTGQVTIQRRVAEIRN